jgi:hypothetical protein
MERYNNSYHDYSQNYITSHAIGPHVSNKGVSYLTQGQQNELFWFRLYESLTYCPNEENSCVQLNSGTNVMFMSETNLKRIALPIFFMPKLSHPTTHSFCMHVYFGTEHGQQCF